MTAISASFMQALEPVLTAFADDELVIGHRHSEWTGWAPHIEEDIAFSSIAQDEIGHATAIYGLLAELTDRSADVIALGRTQDEYRNAIVCERANRDWAYTIARHFVYEYAERLRLESLSDSAYRPLADLAVKVLREERYHQLHADAWFRRIAGGPVEGRHQLGVALSEVLYEAIGLFEPLEDEANALEHRILATSSNDLLQRWLDEVMGRIEGAGIPVNLARVDHEPPVIATSSGEILEEVSPSRNAPSIQRNGDKWRLEGDFPALGGRRGKHSNEFESLWDDLTKTYREEPTATW